MVTSHQITLSGLAAGTTYYYQVNSTDSKGNHGHGGGKFNTAGFNLSGAITPTAAGSGATVALSGGASASATADSSGNYTFAGLANGSYMVTPKHTGYAFTPGNQSATVNGANVSGVNFTANAAPVAPSITAQPASQTVTAGQTASFSVAATGTAPLNYQWQKNGTAISGATSSSYTTPTTTSSDNGEQFTVVVSNTAGSVTINAATLTVNAAPVAPSITTQPTSQTVTAGQTASFSVAATGTAPLSYQWKKNGTAVAGATSSGYTTPATTNSDNGAQFAVLVSNAAGSATSNVATLTVNVPQPPSVSITSPAIGTTVSGAITVAGTASDAVGLSSVQVQIDGGVFSPSSGTTNWTFSLDTALLPNAVHSVTARATNSSGLTASTTITLNVSNTGTIINVLNYGAIGNGSTDDTTAVNSAIAALQPGDTLLFPCTSSSTYLLSSQLTLNISNFTVDGSTCAILHNISSGAVMVIGGSGNGNPNYGPAVALSSTANELATTFSTVSSLGLAPGDYLLLQQGGKDSSTGSGDTGCDPSGCRGELLKVASVSGNTITVTTALHDTYNPSLNGATARKILNPLTAVTVKNITFDGNGSNVYGLEIAGVAESSVTGITSRNVQGSALLNRGDFNVSWSNISVTGAGSAQCGSAVWFENQGNLSVNNMSISNENQGASGSGCLYNGAFGFELIASANSTITNLTVDAAGAYARPFKTTAARYNTFNSPTVKNGVQAYNGISLEYYSSHNTYNTCTVTNNGAGTGTGTGNAGIITFGNFNQYNSFNNCTVSGNGNVQFYISGYDALRLAQDSHNTVSGGTFTGSNNAEAVLLIQGDGTYITGATISGPGAQGIYLDTQASNACVNNNTFTLVSGLGSAINANGSNDFGLGNLLNLLGSDLTAGSCAATLP